MHGIVASAWAFLLGLWAAPLYGQVILTVAGTTLPWVQIGIQASGQRLAIVEHTGAERT
jgi:hypothetical protein